MKKLIFIALAFIAVQATAQQRNDRPNRPQGERMERFKDMTPEEMATLQTKKMALQMDLTESQQKEIQKINLENAKERKARMEARRNSGNMRNLSKEERLKIANERLDRQIEMKAKMKKILNEEQYAKWEQNQQRMMDRKERMPGPKGQKQGKNNGPGQGPRQ